jgi:hypothetical protein
MRMQRHLQKLRFLTVCTLVLNNPFGRIDFTSSPFLIDVYNSANRKFGFGSA